MNNFLSENTRRWSVISLFTFAALLTALPALAQNTRPVEVIVGAGFTTPTNDSGKKFGIGGNLDFGANFNVTPIIALQAKYGFTRFGRKDFISNFTDQIGQSIPLSVHHTMHSLDFSAIIGPRHGDAIVAPYGIVGGGYWHETLTLTTPAVGLGTVCDPWFYVCYVAPVAVDQIIGDRSADNFGVQFGAGFTVRIGETTSFYGEFRYVHTYGPTITIPGGIATPNAASKTVKANGNYWPVTFGFRF